MNARANMSPPLQTCRGCVQSALMLCMPHRNARMSSFQGNVSSAAGMAPARHTFNPYCGDLSRRPNSSIKPTCLRHAVYFQR